MGTVTLQIGLGLGQYDQLKRYRTKMKIPSELSDERLLKNILLKELDSVVPVEQKTKED
jgi:hypothetical protein